MISTALHAPLSLEVLWMERDNWLLPGLSTKEARETPSEPEVVHRYLPHDQTSDSLWEVCLRAGKAAQSLINRIPGYYLTISHGGLLNMLFYAILGMAPHANLQGPRFRFISSAFATWNMIQGYIVGLSWGSVAIHIG